jgi:hypothetical protein
VLCTLRGPGGAHDLIAVANDAVTIVVDGPGPDGVLVATEGDVATSSVSADEVRA